MQRPHHRRLTFMIAALALCALAMPAASRAESESATQAELAKMPWTSGSHALGQSHGTFVAPAGDAMVQDANAARVDDLLNGTTGSTDEAIVRIPSRHALLYMEYDDAGYVTLDDWKDMDATKMLADMSKNDEDSNDERRKNGAAGIHVDQWIQPPTLDRANNTVRYIVALHDDDKHPFLNAVALALGRRGYERFTLAAGANDPNGSRTLLTGLVHDYTFSKGFRFSDYVQGDKLAGIGVAALVSSVAGVAIAKTVGFGAVLLLIKKFFVVIIAAVAGGFGWLKKRFSNKNAGEKWQA